MSKTIEDMMSSMTDPDTVELNTRYQNSRDAVSWSYNMAKEIVLKHMSEKDTGASVGLITILARELMPAIEMDLNKTLDVLKEKTDGKRT